MTSDQTNGLVNRMHRPERSKSGAAQGEALATWALWAAVLAVLALTYARLDPAELYHVSRDGLAGGVSRVVVVMNFPLALVAIALALIALDALRGPWWWIGGPAIAMCALTAWPGVVDQADLDVRPVNAIPAFGVMLAFALTLAAATRSGTGVATQRPFDAGRTAIGALVLVLSLPWIAADLGVFLPDWVFITERPITGSDGNVTAAVHLGHHHGFDGALLIIGALLLSRPRLRSPALARATALYVSLMFAYGAVNFVQDLWHEQIQKRGWIDWKIPSALKPTLTPIWLVILVITVGTTLLIRYENRTVPGVSTRSAVPSA